MERLERLRKEIDRLLVKDNWDEARMYLSHMAGVMRFCTLLAMKRELDVELATACGLLHDICYMTGGGSDNHAQRGAEQARAILTAMDGWSGEEIELISAAVARHSRKEAVHGPYDELLKDADMMDHCLYNGGFPADGREADRYRGLLAELGVRLDKRL